MKTPLSLDMVCDHESNRSCAGLPPGVYRDPFYQWVADLGRREGGWLRSPR